MKDWWQIWPRYFTKQECDAIVKLALQQPQEPTLRLGSIALEGSKGKYTNSRKLNRLDADVDWLVTKLEHAFRRINGIAFQFNLQYFYELIVTEYVGEASVPQDWTEDISWTTKRASQKKLTLLLQLSDSADYNGGELLFEHSDLLHIMPNRLDLKSKGTILVFPSFLKYTINPVTHGTCYKLATWYEGPHFS